MGGRDLGDGSRDRLDPGTRSTSCGVDVHEHVLAGRKRVATRRVPHRVEEMEPLLVGAENLRQHLQRLESGDLPTMPEVRLDRVGAVTALEVPRVDSDVAEEGVRRLGEDVG